MDPTKLPMPENKKGLSVSLKGVVARERFFPTKDGKTKFNFFYMCLDFGRYKPMPVLNLAYWGIIKQDYFWRTLLIRTEYILFLMV
jgi:hypothetical protein